METYKDRTVGLRLWLIAFSVFLIVLLAVSSAASATVSVTVVNQSDYPWLVKDSYADYLGPQYDYVLPNGTLTIFGLTTGGVGVASSSGNTSLDWTMLNRTGDSAWIQILYHASGCDSSESQYQDYFKNNFTKPLQCVQVDFSTSLTLEVNVPTGQAYVNDYPVGVLNFWEPPLLDNQPAYVGTAFVGGVRYDLMANASAPSITHSSNCSPANPCSQLSGPTGNPLTINESGSAYSGPFTYYTLAQTRFGTGSHATYGWVNSTNENINSNMTFAPKVDPSGFYNYYSGLALQLTQPDYPVPQTVCQVNNGQPVDCSYTTYGTTLGTYFRSAQAELFLTATNIPIEPSQTPANQSSTSQSLSGFPMTTWDVISVVSAIVVISGFVVAYRVRTRRQERGPKG